MLVSKGVMGCGLVMICMTGLGTLNSSSDDPSDWCKCNFSGLHVRGTPLLVQFALTKNGHAVNEVQVKLRFQLHAVGAHIALSGGTAI